MRRAIIAILILAIILGLSVAGYADTPEVCFTALNETVLDLSQTPYFYNGTAFVPYKVFSSFRVYSSYFASNNTISLYRSDRQLYFNLNTGQVFDGDDNYYSTPTVRKNGVVYVSVPFVCNYFGLSWSYIKGIGYGDILRITDSGSYLSDSEFIHAASGVMQPRYESYIESLSGSSSPSPSAPGSIDSSDTPVYISFEGMPDDILLDTLQRFGVKCAFYLSPDDIASAPDTVRRIYGSGHSIGIYCGADPAGDYQSASALLLEAANIRTVMVSSSGEHLSACQTYAQENRLKMNTYDLDAADRQGYGISSNNITTRISNTHRTVHLRFDCSNSTQKVLSNILNFLNNNNYALRIEREV